MGVEVGGYNSNLVGSGEDLDQEAVKVVGVCVPVDENLGGRFMDAHTMFFQAAEVSILWVVFILLNSSSISNLCGQLSEQRKRGGWRVGHAGACKNYKLASSLRS